MDYWIGLATKKVEAEPGLASSFIWSLYMNLHHVS